MTVLKSLKPMCFAIKKEKVFFTVNYLQLVFLKACSEAGFIILNNKVT